MGIRWNSALHPRDNRGRFRKKGMTQSKLDKVRPKTQGKGIRLSRDEIGALGAFTGYGVGTYGGLGLVLGGPKGALVGAGIGSVAGALDASAVIRNGRRAQQGSRVKR